MSSTIYDYAQSKIKTAKTEKYLQPLPLEEDYEMVMLPIPLHLIHPNDRIVLKTGHEAIIEKIGKKDLHVTWLATEDEDTIPIKREGPLGISWAYRWMKVCIRDLSEIKKY